MQVHSSSNWAVLISTSRFYSNYRHTVDTLLIYQLLKRYNFPDDHIIMMLPENHQCHPRNPFPGKIFDSFHSEDLMSEAEIDYRGLEVTPESIINLLTGRHESSFPNGKRLNSDSASKVFLFFNGHGGNGYLKVQNTMVLKSGELAYAVNEMYLKKRFGELLIVIDSCQALSMLNHIDLPGVHGISSSLTGEPAKSYGTHADVGVSITDHFSYFFSELFRGRNATSIERMNLDNAIKQLPEKVIQSRIGYKSREKAWEVNLAQFITYGKAGKEKEKEEGKEKEKEVESVVEECGGRRWGRWEEQRDIGENFIRGEKREEIWTAVGAVVIGTIVFYFSNIIY